MILNFINKKNKIRAREKLNQDAQRYFVTVSQKLLTPFGDEKRSRKYITFRIYDDNFFVLLVTRDYLSKNKIKDLASVRFAGDIIIDQKSGIKYSYGAFENYLENLVGDELVHDFYIEHLWKKISEQRVD